ncbi:recombination protein NinG [Pseudomonas capsici]|uniref:recombination protein NinG n=1 Tax=Pseudomonas capsici TaxID=2810614 RepID=UPI0021F13314|nr:recombination protein NinG [Pseudomonas capsici]MCV4285075.1 recombination protein NinG [Pseudomonas capsici]
MKRTELKRTVPLKASGITPRNPRKKKCAHCGEVFQPTKMGQKACGPACALAMAPVNQERARKALAEVGRKEIKARKEALKRRSDHMREAQALFNRWIRLRDADLPCVSCGRHHQGKYDAGHYRTTAASPELRFEPLNVWKQCSPCNTQLSGNIVNYRLGLVRRIGEERVAWIEGPHEPKRYTIADLQEIKAECRAKIKELEGKAA